MKKLLLIPVLVTLSVMIGFLVLPTVGLAACDSDEACEPDQGETPDNCSNDCAVPASDPMATLSNILNWLFTILMAFAGIMIVIAAFSFVTAAGNPETVAKARQFVMYALIGVVVALMSRGMLWLVLRMVK
jgi:hypothetical protein